MCQNNCVVHSKNFQCQFLSLRVFYCWLFSQENCSELESQVEAQIRALVAALEERRAALLDFVRADRDVRLRALKDQVAQCTSKLQHTTGLMQFCIEALKETDPPAFLQVSITSCYTKRTSKERSSLSFIIWKICEWKVCFSDRGYAHQQGGQRGHDVVQGRGHAGQDITACRPDAGRPGCQEGGAAPQLHPDET